MNSASLIHEFYDIKAIDRHFDKLCTFENLEFSHDRSLSEDEFEQRFISDQEWKSGDLKLIEENVNRVKNKLNNYKARDWSLHTNKFCLLNIYGCYGSFNNPSKEKQDAQRKPELFTR